MNALDSVLHFLFPPRCPVCGKEQDACGDWCEPCLGRTLAVRRLALSPRSSLDGAWACSAYDSAAGALIRALKYKGKRSALPCLGTLLAAGEAKLPASLLQADLAVPIPLHGAKERARGFNQTELIFRPWLASRGIRFERLLIRERETPPLYGRGAKERAAALRSAFALREGTAQDAVRGAHILLLDDILTTGATLEEAAKCLRRAGAKSVRALVAASDHD